MNITAEMQYISKNEYKTIPPKRVAVFQFWIYPGRKLASICVPIEDTYNMDRLLGYKDWTCVGTGNVIETVGQKPILHEWNDLAVKVEYKQTNPSPCNPYNLWIQHLFNMLLDNIEWRWSVLMVRIDNWKTPK